MPRHFGFTGTRRGMTELQCASVEYWFGNRYGVLHHGCCVGADEQANAIARARGWRTEGHPPISQRYLADCEVDFRHKPREYLARDRDIVDTVVGLLAAPAHFDMEFAGSGTWYTIRYAMRCKVPVTIVFPDGEIRFDA